MPLKSYDEKIRNRTVIVSVTLHRWQYAALKHLSAETRVPRSELVRGFLAEPLKEECLERLGVHAEKLLLEEKG